MRSLVDQNVSKLHFPTRGGRWSDTPGNSEWIPDDNALFHIGHSHYLSGKELKNQHHFSSILYRTGDPDFTPFADQTLGQVRLSAIPPTRGWTNGGSYALAAQAVVSGGAMPDTNTVRSYMKQHHLVWHECGDGHTMLAIPEAINQAFVHTGGIGLQKSMKKLGYHVSSYGSLALHRTSFAANGHITAIRKRRRK